MWRATLENDTELWFLNYMLDYVAEHLAYANRRLSGCFDEMAAHLLCKSRSLRGGHLTL